MAEQKVPAKSAIEKAVLLSLQNGEKLERKPLISKSIEKHGFSKELLKDKSCESLSTELKSLTGVVINEMLAKGILINEVNLYFAPPVEKEFAKTNAEAKSIEAKIDLTLNFLEYLLATVDEQLEQMDSSKR